MDKMLEKIKEQEARFVKEEQKNNPHHLTVVWIISTNWFTYL